MTPEEYVDFHKYPPLNINELNRGKDSLNISNTQDPMPWEEVYTRIVAGMDMEHIAEIYGQGRKIALWAIHDNIKHAPEVTELLEGEIDQRRKMQQIEEATPVAAATLYSMANEYAPDAAKNIAVFANKAILAATDDLDKPKRTTLDLVNLTKAVQTASDVLGHTQRHASGAQTTNNTVLTGGWMFELNAPQDQLEIIEAETDDTASTN